MVIDKTSGINYIKNNPNTQQPPREAKPIERQDNTAGDLVSLSAKMKMQPRSAGIVNTVVSPDAGVGYVTEPLQIEEIGIGKIMPWNCEENVKQGMVDNYFMHMDTDFLQTQADKLAAGGKIYPPTVDVRFFEQGIRSMFTGLDQDALHQSVEKMIYEYAERTKNGENVDPRDLKSTLSIKGTEVTMKQLLDMQDAAKVFAGSGGLSWGSDLASRFANNGILKAAAVQYAKNLPGELGADFEKQFSSMWDNSTRVSNSMWMNQTGTPSQEYQSRTSDTALQQYELFSSIDFSGASVARASFQKALGEFTKTVSSGENFFPKSTVNAFQKDLTKVFEQVYTEIFG